MNQVETPSAPPGLSQVARANASEVAAAGLPGPHAAASERGFRQTTRLERVLLAVSLAVVLLYSDAFLIALPYAGFDAMAMDGTIGKVWNPLPNGVREGDRVVSVDGVPYAVFRQDLRQMFWPPDSGPIVSVSIERAGQALTVELPLSQFSWREFSERVFSQWWLAWLFWLAALAQVLLVRPADGRRLLLTAFLCMVAMWLGASTVSRWQLWESALVMRATTWGVVALAVHLHWIFPTSLRPLPRGVWLGLHTLTGLFAVGEITQRMPSQAYLIGFLVAVVTVVVLMGLHWLRKPRPASLHVLTWAGLGTFLPTALLSATTLFDLPPTNPSILGLLGLPLLPAGYVLAAQRGQLDGLEFRANRWVSLYLYVVAIGLTVGLVGVTVSAMLGASQVDLPIWLGLLIVTAALSPGLYPRFQRWIERHILRMPIAPEHLLRTLAGRVVACPDLPSLLAVLRDEVWPALLVRQWALIGLGEDGPAQAVHAERAPALETVPARVWARLQREPEALAVIRLRETALDGLRLALPLAVNGAPVGLLLLGRRDPDDVYAPDEVEAIRALANQTAIALAHIVQTGRLRAFFQANIDRHEEERTELARELHDDILNELGRLRSGALGADADATYGRVIGSVRGMISGLRPAALSFGLQVALEQLADDLSARGPLPVTARFTGAADGWRYDPLVEQHLYRIAQQAAENALKHAAPTRVVIEAELHAEQATLAVIDDGRGLPPGLATDLDALLEHRHFGLAGMHERAALIGAHVRIDPHPPQGTRVQVTWLRT